MPRFKGTGTTEEIASEAASLDLTLDIPSVQEQDVTIDPLPSLAEGEGIPSDVPFLERVKLGLETTSPTYNVITGLLSKPYDPEVDPNFKLSENTDLLQDVDESNYDYMLESTSRADAEHRLRTIKKEQQQMHRLMQDGAISGLAISMAAGTVLDPLFYASMLTEGAAGLNTVNKVQRMIRLGAAAGGTAAGETAVLASQRATVDAEDVLYAGAAGLALGTAFGAIGKKALKAGDNFSAASDAVQDNFSKVVTAQMDENLVKPVKRSVAEPESIFGKFDPDEIAARKAERQAEETVDGIPIKEEPDEDTLGYAKALYQNIEELKASGEFNPTAIKNSTAFKVLRKNPMMSDFIRLFDSESEGIQYLASELLENASGVAGRQKTAAILKHIEERKFLEQTMPVIRKSFSEYTKDNKIGVVSRAYWGKAREDHFRIIRTELENYRNAAIAGTEYVSTAPKYIQDAVDAWRKGMIDAAELAKVSGVRGFDEIVVHDGYVPLFWNGAKLARLSTSARKSYRKLLSKGYQRAGIDKKSADTIAKAVFNRKIKQAVGLDTNPGALLSKDSREFLREMLDLNGVPKAEQDALFGRIDVTLAERGKSARAKHRVPIDLTVSENGKSLFDIVDNDLASIGSRYFTEMAGRSALARKGIRHDGAWRAVKNAVLKEAFEKGEDTTKLGKVLDGTYQQFLGQPVGEGVNKGARRLMEWAMTSMLGTVGMAQMAESANVIAAHSVSNLMKYAPDLSAFRKAIKNGTADSTLLGEMQAHIGGLWDEHLFYRPEVRLEQTRTSTDGYWRVLDNVLAGSREFLGYASGMNAVKNIQQQFVAVGQANKVIKFIKEGSEDAKILARFKDIGWDESTLRRIKNKIDDGTITFQENGAVDRLHLESWDAQTLEDFSVGIHRHSAQLIQFPLVGETAFWQHSTIGAMLSQFRSFSMLAIEKQTTRNIRLADPEAFTAFTYSIGLSALLYMTKVQAMSVGRPDREEYLEKRLNPGAIFNGALQWSGVFSIASEGVNTASAIGLLPADWGSGSIGRTGGSAFSFDKQVPSLSAVRSGMKFSTGLLTGISPFNDHTVGNKEIDNFFASVPLGNIYPSIVLKNLLHNIPEDN